MSRAPLVAVLLLGLVSPAQSHEPGSKAADPSSPETVGAWSPAEHGLRARLVTRDLWVTDGTTTLGVYLELENVSDVGTPMRIRWDDRRASFVLTDAAGKPVEQAHLPRGGPQPVVDLLVVPYDGRLRFRVSVTGVMCPRGQRWLIALPDQDWVVARKGGPPLLLSATVSVPRPGGTSHDWYGELRVPPLRLVP